jgi:hypothetical protein
MERLLRESVDALVQDGELLKVRLAALPMVLLEFLQQTYLEVHIHCAGTDRVTLTFVLEVDISQSPQERLEQRLKVRRVHPRLGHLLGSLCGMMFGVGHRFPP